MPAVSFIPHFPDDTVDLTVGDFHLWSWLAHRDRFVADARIRAYLDRYFDLFRRSNGDPETRIVIIQHASEQPFGEEQDLRRLSRFTNALMASYLFNLPTAQDFPFCSSDNFVGLHQRFDPAADNLAVAFTVGSYFRMTTTGSWDHLRFATPQFVPDMPCEALTTMLPRLANLCSDMSERVVRLFRSLQWLRLTFMNYEGFQHEARLVAMCTAFETLLDFPDSGKARYFSEEVNRLIPANRLARSTHQVGRTPVADNAIGWWCRDFYALRSRIVHGEAVQAADFRTGNGVDVFRLALSIFEECIWGLLLEWGCITREEREIEFAFRAHWRDQLGLPREAFH